MLLVWGSEIQKSTQKKADQNTYNISSIKRVNRKFHVVVKKEVYKKSVMHHLRFFFVVVFVLFVFQFFLPFSLPSPFIIALFNFLFE